MESKVGLERVGIVEIKFTEYFDIINYAKLISKFSIFGSPSKRGTEYL